MADKRPGELIIIFTRFPEPGKTKTRLVPALGEERAAELQRLMAENVVARARGLAARRPISLEVRFTGGSASLMEEWLGGGISFKPQGRGDVGRRMAAAFRDAFEEGAKSAVLAGTDLPGLSEEIFERALDALNHRDLVFGPAKDGGYYLIGMKRARPALFSGIEWGGPDVFEKTLDAARELGLSVAELDLLADVDRPEDLALLREFREYSGFAPPKISVVIPALNEAANIERAVSSAAAAPFAEVIVADGGSADGTAQIAKSLGARVVSAPRGRALQMNLGAREAQGDALLFLHADSVLPPGYQGHVAQILKRPGVAAGAFEFAVRSNKRGMRIIEALANFRARRLEMPYGDQAIFMTRRIFETVGGFPEMEIMEDYELMLRLKRLGRVEVAREKVVTSARRWERLGVLRATLINQAVILGYHLGVSTGRLAGLYCRKRGAGSRGRSLS